MKTHDRSRKKRDSSKGGACFDWESQNVEDMRRDFEEAFSKSLHALQRKRAGVDVFSGY